MKARTAAKEAASKKTAAKKASSKAPAKGAPAKSTSAKKPAASKKTAAAKKPAASKKTAAAPKKTAASKPAASKKAPARKTAAKKPAAEVAEEAPPPPARPLSAAGSQPEAPPPAAPAASPAAAPPRAIPKPTPKRTTLGGPPPGLAVPSFLLGQMERAARDVFGVARLHHAQETAIEAVMRGRDAMAVLPTGFGKSLIYQLPAVLLDRPVLVVSPLIALMRDQEEKLLARGVPVVRLDSTLRAQERRDALARVEKGGRLVVLTTPETLQAKDAQPAIVKAQPAVLAVDEAHCISEWGHDFRPAYLQLAAAREVLGVSRILALTATATPRVREDIAQRLGLQDPVVVLAPPDRANLRLSVHVVSGPSVKLELAGRILHRLPRPGILYCATTRAVDDIYAALSHTKIPCARYHGGMSDEERSASQARFMAKDARIVMIATSAFGMGIDKSNIRYIVHFQVPGSLEQYVQEAGRAGRDGLLSDCVLLFDRADLRIQELLESQGRPTGTHIKRVARAIAAWSQEEESEGVNANDLALSAGVPAGVARAVCTELADANLIELDGRRRAKASLSAKELERAAGDLAIRFDIIAAQEEKRLDAITAYAEADECRSAFIRRWFGETHPPRCGRCDVCRVAARIRELEEAEAKGIAPPPAPDDPTAKALPQAGRRPQRQRGKPKGQGKGKGRGKGPRGGRRRGPR